ncbi:winged helix-turn-helix transcriptional regulator [Streptomyces sp. NPDC060027]|uniref:winged helix-turn-helix transcriptional regulator n=1 Tax=Streptomyces sp. NPDC060027 TaxID=3347040 RepID=UPI00367A9451
MSQYEHTCMIRGDGGRTIRAVLDRICDKWKLLIVTTLERGHPRFTDPQRQIPGISQRMLTLTLRNLERDGLVSRSASGTGRYRRPASSSCTRASRRASRAS